MAIRIYREGGRFHLDAEKLAQRVRIDGFVVFVSTRTRQREIARKICNLLEAQQIPVLLGETNSPNWCMCVVDTDRSTLREILDVASQEDRDYEARFENS